MEVDEDVEDDDVDFNPFLRDVTPSETSSSLTSDTECEGTSSDKQLSSGLYLPNSLRVSDGNVSTQHRLSSGGGCYEETAPENISPLVCYENGGDGLSELNNEELPSQAARPLMEQNPCRLMLEVSEEDAICRRTRARYSLANYSLEELETFLQESDDDGDLQNVDEEEEYHKFLAAVLLGAGDGTHACQGDENQDEDENDADFELEIEEALESDGDDNAENYEDMDCRKEKDGHRPQTRQKRRLTELIGAGNYSHELTKSPLRPILPYISPVLLDPGHSYGWPHTTLFLSSSLLSGAGAALLNGFTDQQMGQLHVLIHEHVQLLIQTFSLCVLDPSKQHVAADVKKMIFEIVGCRDQALARRNIPHQQSCFESQYLCSSFNSSSSKSSEFLWAPLIKSPVLSILDVAPLQLATGYLNDVTAAVVKYRRSHVDGTADRSHSRKEPLFPLSEDDTSKANNGSQGRSGSVSASSPVSSGQLQHKKSLAATLVESTKKESVALVPSDIARLAQRFYDLFNISLFPHKPPPAAVANRVLFTDAEDGLLALGLLEYNNDWEAIQKRFLPCKSKHQIFVRQKNRSSSKAPDNPIKDVRRMKTSPLTIEEKERIQEGLKVFKNDWTSVWRFFVPHRDPSLLQRQWRVATGAQKSYSKSEAAKEKRRLYEAKRRKLKASLPDSLVRELEGDNEVADCADGVENDDDSYVNEAFLADTEDKSSNMLPYQLTFSSPARKIMQPDRTMMQSGTNLGEECGSAADDCREPQKANGTKFDVIAPSKPLEATNSMSNRSNMSSCTSYATSSKYSFSTKLRSSGGPLVQMQSSKLCKDKGSRVVRLAPDLPPVNLPPTVRVISQLEFHKNAPHYDGTSNNAAKVLFPVLPPDFTESSCRSNSLRQLNLFPDHSASVSLQRNGASNGNTTEDATESDFQMHPLLFQYPREGFSSYSHPVRDFIDHSRRNDLFPFEKLQIEKNVNLRKASIEKETPVNANTIDFHPLLQRTEDRNYGEMPEGDCHQFIDQPELRESLVEGQSTARQPSASTCERENNLDLDIHLCSSMDFPNAKKDCVGMLSKSNIQAEECRRCSTAITEPETGNACSCHCTEEPNEESMQGIVMEQEELSDSEEDSQHVEFECEEMDDSDEEQIQGSGSSPTQNKDISTSVAPGELQGSHDQSQIQQVSAKVGKQGGSAMLKLQSSSHARSARAKSKPENAKRSKSRTSQSASPCRPTQSSRAKMRNSKVQQGHKVAVHKLTVSRRPRKTPAPS